MHGVNVTVTGERGETLMCEQCDTRATSCWYGAGDGKPHLACHAHDPYAVASQHCPGCQCPKT